MGMDYEYAGSASYPRFDRELCDVAAVLGGIETEHLKERKSTEDVLPFRYWFGFASSDDSDEPKFAFPETVDRTVVKWFNNIYEHFTAEETKTVWIAISSHPEIQEISPQIWEELESRAKYAEGWHIC